MECVVSGSALFARVSTSPLLLGVVLASLVTTVVIWYFIRRRARRIADIIVGATIVAMVSITYGTTYLLIQPGLTYGLWVEDATLHIRYLGDRVFSVSLCEANITLLTMEDARSLLKLRAYGVADPATAVSMGEYKLRDGGDAHVVLIGREGYALLVEYGGERALVGFEDLDMKACYEEIASLQATTCKRG